MTTYGIPDGLPVLSRGRHRNPRKGACFMELASVLANERWSDRPTCTHPLLAQLARLVNDHTSDERRGDLVVLIPQVIGVHGHGLDWEVGLTAAVAGRAVYDVPEETQRALAAGLLRCAELAERGDAPTVDTAEIRRALDMVPGATAWARRFIDGTAPLKPRNFSRHAAPAVLLSAVRGTSQAAVSDRDGKLRELLIVGLEVARRPQPAPVRQSAPVA